MKRMLGKGLLSVKGEKDVRKTFFGNDLILQRRPETDPAFYKGTQLCKADRRARAAFAGGTLYSGSGCIHARYRHQAGGGEVREQCGKAAGAGRSCGGTRDADAAGLCGECD